MVLDVKQYAMKLLIDEGCNLDCYRDEKYATAVKDVEAYEKEHGPLPFDVRDIARELIEIGKQQPEPPRKGHAQYCMVYDGGSFIDGIEYDTFEDAKASAIETYVFWLTEAQSEWTYDSKLIPHPTEVQIENYDFMINECCCYIVEWNEELNAYNSIDDAYFIPDEELNQIGWMSFEELKEKFEWK